MKNVHLIWKPHAALPGSRTPRWIVIADPLARKGCGYLTLEEELRTIATGHECSVPGLPGEGDTSETPEVQVG